MNKIIKSRYNHKNQQNYICLGYLRQEGCKTINNRKRGVSTHPFSDWIRSLNISLKNV